MLTIFGIAIGAVTGALLRFLITVFFSTIAFPVSTLVVNSLGCFILGLIWGITEQVTISELLRLGLIVGFCGSLTTFSTIMMDLFQLVADQQFSTALHYFVLTNVLGVLLLGGGILFSKWILQ